MGPQQEAVPCGDAAYQQMVPRFLLWIGTEHHIRPEGDPVQHQPAELLAAVQIVHHGAGEPGSLLGQLRIQRGARGNQDQVFRQPGGQAHPPGILQSRAQEGGFPHHKAAALTQGHQQGIPGGTQDKTGRHAGLLQGVPAEHIDQRRVGDQQGLTPGHSAPLQCADAGGTAGGQLLPGDAHGGLEGGGTRGEGHIGQIQRGVELLDIVCRSGARDPFVRQCAAGHLGQQGPRTVLQQGAAQLSQRFHVKSGSGRIRRQTPLSSVAAPPGG